MKMLLVVIERGDYDEDDTILNIFQVNRTFNTAKILKLAYEKVEHYNRASLDRMRVEVYGECESGNFSKYLGVCQKLSIIQPWQEYKCGDEVLSVGDYFAMSNCSLYEQSVMSCLRVQVYLIQCECLSNKQQKSLGLLIERQ